MEAAFKAINDQTRREILQLLVDGPLNAGEISKQFNMSKPSISHHFDLLKQAQLILKKKKGQFILYSLNKEGFSPIYLWFQGFATHFEFPKPKIRL